MIERTQCRFHNLHFVSLYLPYWRQRLESLPRRRPPMPKRISNLKVGKRPSRYKDDGTEG